MLKLTKMNSQEIIKELKRLYPERNIILNDPDNPTEIICEVEPASWNPEKSVSIVIFDGKIKHPHDFRKETYEVLKGVLEMTKEGKSFFLTEGEKLTIGQDEFHMAKGDDTWVKVTSEPAWSPQPPLPIDEGTKYE